MGHELERSDLGSTRLHAPEHLQHPDGMQAPGGDCAAVAVTGTLAQGKR
jgi:hypothetical protein